MTAILVRQLPIDPMEGTWDFFFAGDPTTGDGYDASVGSLAVRVDQAGLGRQYKKTSAPATGWTEITGGSSSVSVASTTVQGIVEVDDNGAGSPVALTTTGHLLAADPHPQYALDTEKGAASGLATLDGASKLTASQLPLGSSATTAAAGNDARLSDARTPVAHAASHASGGTDPITIAESQVTSLTTDLAARVLTSDARLSDARTPTAHASTHAAAGTDPLTLSESQVTNLVTDLSGKVPTARTVSTTAPLTGGGDLSANRTLAISDFVASGASHARGAVPDPGAVAGTAKFLREDATWAAPAGASAAPYQLIHPATITTSGAVASTERLILQSSQTIQPGTSVTINHGGVVTILPTPLANPTPSLASASTSNANPTFSKFTQNLGTTRSGTFTIAAAGLRIDAPVQAFQTSGAILSKGNARDEAEMDRIQIAGYVVDNATIQFHWWSPNVVVGTYEFAYLVSA